MLGGFLALLSAATFAFNNAATRRGVLSGSVVQALAITVPIGVPIFFVVTAASGNLGALTGFSPTAIFWLSLAGMIHFVWGRYCNYRATKAIGANLTGPLQQFDLIVALGLAIWVLGETLTPLRVLGIVLVIVGPALTMREDFKPQAAGAPAPAGAAPSGAEPFRPNYVEGTIFGLLSATGYGVSPIFVRLGLESAGPGTSLAAGLISYIAATLFLCCFLAWPGRIRHVLDLKPEATKWFTISGVFVCASQIFRYMALALAPVSVVNPILRVNIVFRIIFSWMLNPHHEVFGGKIVLGTAIALLGALALSVSTELVLSLVPLPEWVVALARWQWP